MELNFNRTGGKSRRAKIKSFWEFIDGQKNMVPLRPPQDSTNSTQSSVSRNFDDCCLSSEIDNNSINLSQEIRKNSASDSNHEGDSRTSSLNNENIWNDELRILKELGLDRVALAATNACKRCLRDDSNKEKEPEYADSVPQLYQELAADMKAFQERIKARENPKCAYKDSGKYKHLMK